MTSSYRNLVWIRFFRKNYPPGMAYLWAFLSKNVYFDLFLVCAIVDLRLTFRCQSAIYRCLKNTNSKKS